MKIEEMRRVTLCNLPTPLMEVPALSAKLGGPQILIKRDDLTGLAMGGNKSRMLEFVMSEAKDMGADIVITGGGSQGNTGPQVSAAARRLGMDLIMFTFNCDYTVQGNLLLLNLLAEIKVTGIENRELDKVSKQMESLTTELRNKGRRPYVIPPLGSKAPSALVGYAHAVSEICKQLKEKGLTAQYLFIATSDGIFQAGLSLGVKYFEAPFKIVGVMHSPLTREELVHNITDLVNAAAKFFEMGFTFTSDEVIVYDEYMGEGYGIPTKKSIEAVKLVAQSEGILLDPIYTGRAMAALIDQVRAGKIKRDDTVILYHSGGLPGIFGHSEELLA